MQKTLIIHIVAVFLLHGSHVLAQGNEALIRNDYHAVGIRSDGQFFEKNDSSASYELMGYEGSHLIDFSGMWVVAKNSKDEVVGFISKEKSKSELRSGPIDTLFNKAVNNPGKWDHVWTIDQNDIQAHRNNWDQPDYIAAWGIQNWPAKHSESYVPSVMAPFVDWNRDLKYMPTDGDYPYMNGDAMMYFIANDEGQEHDLSGSVSMNLEIQGQVYTFNKSLPNVVFARIFLINRSDQDYDSLFFGQYNHFALGNHADNHVASNAKVNAIYAYNGDAYDDDHFGEQLPYAACVFLNASLNSSIAFDATDSVRKYPENLTEVWNVSKGKWRTGDEKCYAGKGYKSSQNTGNFIYPHGTDSKHAGVDWRNSHSGDGVGERNALGFVGPYYLKNNGVLKIDLAFVTGLMEDSISHQKIEEEIGRVQGHYNATLNVENKDLATKQNTLYPNPARSGQNAVFQCFAPTNLKLYDPTGRLLIEQSYNAGTHAFEVPRIPGIYLLEHVTGRNKRHSRLVVQ